MPEQRNLILAIALSIFVLIGFQLLWNTLYPPPPPVEQTVADGRVTPGTPSTGDLNAPSVADAPGVTGPRVDGGLAPTAPGGPMTDTLERSLALSTDDSPRVPIDTPAVQGSLRVQGALLDDLVLTEYRETLDPDSKLIHLFSPINAPDPYHARFGWVAGSADGNDAPNLPGPDTPWTVRSGETLAVDQPVVLTWDNGQGLRFTRTVAVDDHYMFTVTQRVENTGTTPVTLYPYGLISRTDRPTTDGIYILHEGPLGVFDGTLTEVNYGDLEDESSQRETTTGGWIGITDKYWLAALAFDQDVEANARFAREMRDGRERFQVDYVLAGQTVQPGGFMESTNHLFAGAKKVELLDEYEESLGITNFDLAIDFGWFYFMTKPFFYCLLWLEDFLGNYGLAILAFTVLLKLVFFPLASKSYESMSKMKKLQPEMKKLQERFKDDKARMNQELMALYKREKANPVSGCLPILVQIPVFFALYKVLYVSIEMRHAPFYGWIQDLSAPDPLNLFTVFGLIPWDPPALLTIGLWPVIMGCTMYLQQILNPAPTDPTQKRIMQFLPLFFTFLLAQFPAGLVIYWTWNNLLSMLQQWWIMKRMGVGVNG
ncbi:membrane protein insertase YidC [Roseospira visakhapatnamensis]|uniref:Membrane protein insertase YidC n=1 Tax=Roseospira visakhapatnamensis TaxID=390880 RepID=A0A7W6RFI5_9PROT|nr:membrane protein insertase YidC [Roseospira visakhapatnamensis]MBB4267548.1 YidC/Oxa1 family membrane protein insertase [Roseospira visakhapatnamensis]